jgi:protein gp37
LNQIDKYSHGKDLSFLKLSGTSKTGITWSLPALGSCPQVDETCGTCYALDGFYRTNIAAQVGRVMRLEYLRELISHKRLNEWVDWMATKINRLKPIEAIPAGVPLDEALVERIKVHEEKVAYFRWHDSGDLFHAEYAKAVFEVCRRTPEVLHWLPTRMGALLARLVRSGEKLPPNLAIQVSCHAGGILEKAQHAAIYQIRNLQPNARIGVTYAHAGSKSRKVTAAEVGSAFGDSAALCPATVATNSADRVCTGCRRCWAHANPQNAIVYAVHQGN